MYYIIHCISCMWDLGCDCFGIKEIQWNITFLSLLVKYKSLRRLLMYSRGIQTMNRHRRRFHSVNCTQFLF